MENPSVSVKPQDCVLHWFSGSGAGGQHRNKHQNCVRLYHPPSGVRLVAQSYREKRENLLDAMTRLSQHPDFRFWVSEELKRLEGQESIEDTVARQLIDIEYTDMKGNPL